MKRLAVAALSALVVLVMGLSVSWAGEGPTNPRCGDFDFLTLIKIEPVQSGEHRARAGGSIILDVDEKVFDWGSTQWGIDLVIVKGGPGANFYPYSPEAFSGMDLHAPLNLNTRNFYGLSHVEFCYDKDPDTPTPTDTLVTSTPTDTLVTPTDTPTQTPMDTSTNTPTDTPAVTPTPTRCDDERKCGTPTVMPTTTLSPSNTLTPTSMPCTDRGGCTHHESTPTPPVVELPQTGSGGGWGESGVGKLWTYAGIVAGVGLVIVLGSAAVLLRGGVRR